MVLDAGGNDQQFSGSEGGIRVEVAGASSGRFSKAVAGLKFFPLIGLPFAAKFRVVLPCHVLL